MNGSDFVVLGGGLILPVAAVRLALDLESRGCRMELDGDGLAISPKSLISDEDRAAIRRWRSHLRAILAYEASTHKHTQ